MALKVGNNYMDHVVYNNTAMDLVYYKTGNTQQLYWARPFKQSEINSHSVWSANSTTIGTISYSINSKFYPNDRATDCYYYGDVLNVQYTMTTLGWYINDSRPHQNGLTTASIGQSGGATIWTVKNRAANKASTLNNLSTLQVSPTQISRSNLSSYFSGQSTYDRINTYWDWLTTNIPWNTIVRLHVNEIQMNGQQDSKTSETFNLITINTIASKSSKMIDCNKGSSSIKYYAYSWYPEFITPYYFWDQNHTGDNCKMTVSSIKGSTVYRPKQSIDVAQSTGVQKMSIQQIKGPISKTLGDTVTQNYTTGGQGEGTSVRFEGHPRDQLIISYTGKPGYNNGSSTVLVDRDDYEFTFGTSPIVQKLNISFTNKVTSCSGDITRNFTYVPANDRPTSDRSSIHLEYQGANSYNLYKGDTYNLSANAISGYTGKVYNGTWTGASPINLVMDAIESTYNVNFINETAAASIVSIWHNGVLTAHSINASSSKYVTCYKGDLYQFRSTNSPIAESVQGTIVSAAVPIKLLADGYGHARLKQGTGTSGFTLNSTNYTFGPWVYIDIKVKPYPPRTETVTTIPTSSFIAKTYTINSGATVILDSATITSPTTNTRSWIDGPIFNFVTTFINPNPIEMTIQIDDASISSANSGLVQDEASVDYGETGFTIPANSDFELSMSHDGNTAYRNLLITYTWWCGEEMGGADIDYVSPAH